MPNRVHPPEGFPTFDQFIWQSLKSIQELGGSATRAEIEAAVIAELKISDEMLEFRGTGKTTKFKRRSSWALTYLKYVQAVQNSERGVWTITSYGARLTAADIPGLVKQVKQRWKTSGESEEPSESDGGTWIESEDESWRDLLLQRLRALKPAAFERLCQLILRESGFVQVEVTGRSGDNGIDGRGVLRVGLISFHVIFQCKRYAGSVGPKELRDFRGAMSGRTDKGLFLTTGTFSSSARAEANREGATPIELIDGEGLTDLLRHLKLGVYTVELVKLREEYFIDLDNNVAST